MSGARIEDELAIRQLVARYSDAVARRDEKDWGATWADDGEWHILGRPTKGRDAIVALWNTLMAGVPFVVQVPNAGTVSIEGTRATGRWTVTEYAKSSDGAGMLTLGVYHDQYCQEGGDWRFARRRFDPLYMGPPDLSGTALPYPENP